VGDLDAPSQTDRGEDSDLAATGRGLVARPMAGFDPEKIRALFGLDADDEPMVMVAVGLPSRDESHLPDHYRGLGNRPRIRREASEIVRRI